MLSGTGRNQARELGTRRRNDGIDSAFISDLGRAVETAEIALAGTDITITQDPRLRECNYGSLNGNPVQRVHRDRTRYVRERYPDGESYQDVVRRMRDFLRELSRDWNGGRVLLISHSANRWALDCLINGSPLEVLVGLPFAWQPGWEYNVPDRWTGD